MSRLAALGRALHAEVLKLRGTLALWMLLIAPALVVGLLVLQLCFVEARSQPLPAAEAWRRFGQSCLMLWSVLMLPLFVTLEAALLAGLEHGERQWKHLLALPLPRAVHYLAKLATLAVLLLLSMAMLALVLMPLGGWLLALLGQQPLHGPPPLRDWLLQAGRIYACALLLVALQTWVALRWRSFTVAVSVGMGATVMGTLIGQSARFGPWFPWTMPVQPLSRHPQVEVVMLVSVGAALVVTVLAAWAFARREAD